MIDFSSSDSNSVAPTDPTTNQSPMDQPADQAGHQSSDQSSADQISPPDQTSPKTLPNHLAVEVQVAPAPRSEESDELKPDQQRAIALLAAGKSITESASTVGINRATIYRWLNHDPAFKAAYNQWQDHLQRTCHSQLLMMAEKATAAVFKALETGDAKTGLQLLKGMGILRPQTPGPTDPAEVRREMDLEKKQRLLTLKKAEGQTASDQFFIDMGMVDWELSERKKR
jgi:hypothetical protein